MAFFLFASESENSKYSIDVIKLLSDRDIIKVVHFNYLCDLTWFTSTFPEYPTTFVLHKCPVSLNTNYQFIQPILNIPFGTHHTKMSLIYYPNQLRIIIHTANLIESDFLYKTQGAWVSPLLSLKSPNVEPCRFEQDLVDYLTPYGQKLNSIIQEIQEFDFTPCNKVFLISSTPGRHKSNNFGLLRLQKILKENYSFTDYPDIIAQCSSVDHWENKRIIGSRSSLMFWHPKRKR
jgi:tyrosyl-DNA phosphodiesterase-1